MTSTKWAGTKSWFQGESLHLMTITKSCHRVLLGLQYQEEEKKEVLHQCKCVCVCVRVCVCVCVCK